jgi:preprotein translocase subunit YajC
VIISQAFAQTAPAASGGGTESSLLSLLPLVLMFVVLYFIMIRPQMKRQKEHKAMVEALAKGDEVVTSGGVLGRVSKLGETYTCCWRSRWWWAFCTRCPTSTARRRRCRCRAARPR